MESGYNSWVMGQENLSNSFTQRIIGEEKNVLG